MDLKITGKCFIEKDSDIILDSAGSRVPAKSVIVCKQKAFIIMEDEDIDRFSGEGMGVIYQATDEHFNFFETPVRELDAERKPECINQYF